MSSRKSSSKAAVKRAKPAKPPPRKPKRPPSKYYFDEAAADRVCQFFELFLCHSKGEWAGQPFHLEPWQRKILRTAFGWKQREDGLRRYRTVYLRVPRKNGKSTIAAGVTLYLLFGDDEAGAELYGAANDKIQASIIFKEAANMVLASTDLSERSQVFKGSTKSIIVPDTMSSYQVLSSDSGNKDGLNPHGGPIDELHEFHDRELWDKLMTAAGSRRQPMWFVCTTAGVGRHTLYAEIDAHAKKVASGEVEDDSFLPVLYGADKEDNWHDEKGWAKANPNLGVSVKLSFLRDQHRKAVLMPAYENTFKRYYLNIDTEQETLAISIEAWDRCGAVVEPSLLVGQPCWVGLDLSRRTDITASVAVFKLPDGLAVLPRFYVPADCVADRSKRDGVPYADWISAGLIRATPGNVIDYSYIKSDLEEWGKSFEIQEIAYDPYGATQLAIQLEDLGFTCVEHRQGFLSMSEPIKKFEELMLSRKLMHGCNPVLRWMAGNVAAEVDAAENIKYSKRKSTGRIDGIIAMVMALGRATLGETGPSVYTQRGLVSI